tara:strand:+ start:146 stop:529 length:384 start_codon:yes stop_codon:yes gene_type:complete
MSEYEALNLMYLGFAFNALYTLGYILLTWLGFRMARSVYEDVSANMLGKVFTSIFCLFVALFFIQSNMIGGGILQSYTTILVDMGSSSGERLSSYANSPTMLGGPVQTIFHLFILIFQLALVWTKKK